MSRIVIFGHAEKSRIMIFFGSLGTVLTAAGRGTEQTLRTDTQHTTYYIHTTEQQYSSTIGCECTTNSYIIYASYPTDCSVKREEVLEGVSPGPACRATPLTPDAILCAYSSINSTGG